MSWERLPAECGVCCSPESGSGDLSDSGKEGVKRESAELHWLCYAKLAAG